MSGTGILAQIYVCPTHGDVDGVYHEDIDTENDEIYPVMLCSKGCGHTVTEKTTADGIPCMREVEHDELMIESMLEESEW